MKTGRNDPCPCGSGKKFKKCCETKMVLQTGTTPGPDPSLARLLHEAIGHHQAGRLDKAEALYRLILEKSPKHADALHLLGMVFYQSGNYTEAEKLLKQAIAVDNKTAFFHLNLGNVLKALGRNQDAIASFRTALSLQPEMAEAHYNLATELCEIGNPEGAVPHFKAALRCNPDLTEAHYNLGVALKQLNRKEEAIESCIRAVKMKPDYYDAHYNLGILYHEMKQYDKAAAHYELTVKGMPRNSEAHYFLGNVYLELEQYDNAEVFFKKAIEICPDFAAALNDCSVTLRKQGRTDEALIYVQRSLEIEPGFAAYNNLGITYREDGKIKEAIINAERAILLSSDSAEAHLNLALALLHSGDFTLGWEKYEWRALKSNSDLRSLPYPIWDGSSLKDKTLFICSEQGIGDQIMFASLFPDIIAGSKHCIVDCDGRLVTLLTRSFPELTVTPAKKQISDEKLPAIDTSIPMGSLPIYLRPHLKSFPQQGSYLVADAEKIAEWQGRFKTLGDGVKIGISWRGGKDASVRYLRSTALEQWGALFSIPGIHFINLQYGDCVHELNDIRDSFGVTIHDWDDADPLKDIDNFAAEIAALDLVISVDNSTVHMAGALGISTWVLLPKACDWRWMCEFEDSPWYSSVRLFRQHAHREWTEVFDLVSEILRDLAPRALAEGNNNCFLPAVKKSYMSAINTDEHITAEKTIDNPLYYSPEEMKRREAGKYKKTGDIVRGSNAFSEPEQRLIDRPIYILGVPRSGTSMVAGLLNLCGAWAGETVSGGPSNPRGFFENIVLREKVTKKILSTLNCDPLGVTKLPDLDLLPDVRDLDAIVKQAIKAEGYTEDRPWLYKGAKLSLIWPIFQSAFPSARWIIVRRRNDDIIRSCLRTHFMVQNSRDPLFWSAWINEYLDRLDKLKQSGVWWREIWPHDFVEGDFGILHQLVDDLDLTWDEDKVRQFILPGSWHASEERNSVRSSGSMSYVPQKNADITTTAPKDMNNPVNVGQRPMSETDPEQYLKEFRYDNSMLSPGASKPDLIDRPIFILGLARSGTSMLAGLLNVCGAWAGKTVPGGSPVNPRGFFEHIVLREKVNKKILSDLKCDPLGVNVLPKLDLLPGIPNFSEIVKRVIRSEGYTEDRPWLFKDAKLTLLWPIYKAAFPSARWIIARRNNDDVIRSCLKTNFMVQHSCDPAFWARWIDEYLERLEKLKQSGVWWREIWPHDFVSGDFGVLHQLIDELGLNWNENAVRDFILPGSWHSPKHNE